MSPNIQFKYFYQLKKGELFRIEEWDMIKIGVFSYRSAHDYYGIEYIFPLDVVQIISPNPNCRGCLCQEFIPDIRKCFQLNNHFLT